MPRARMALPAKPRRACLACGAAIEGARLCERCKSGDTPADLLRGDYIRITCRGDRASNGAQHARRCEQAKVWPRGRAKSRLSSFNPEDNTYICDSCHGLVIQRLGATKRLRCARREGARGHRRRDHVGR